MSRYPNGCVSHAYTGYRHTRTFVYLTSFSSRSSHGERMGSDYNTSRLNESTKICLALKWNELNRKLRLAASFPST